MGFIVNPIAGMGGRVGLKGTDGVLEEALRRGAKPVAPGRAREFLSKLKKLGLEERLRILTCPAPMGAGEVEAIGLRAEVLPLQLEEETSAEDTKRAVRMMVETGVDLIVFVGGDGTAKDILDALGCSADALMLGVPSGVKMYSGIFAVSPSDAAEVVEALLEGEAEVMEFEVMDADEEAIRRDEFIVRLYGLLRGPYVPARIQRSKQVTLETVDELENQRAIARFVVEEMDPDGTYILGPGTTVKRVAEQLGVDKTLLGVDIYQGGAFFKDVNEEEILRVVRDWDKTWIVVSPIGRQGILFGRGNQQITPEILRRVGKRHIIVLATTNKLRGIEGEVLRVDTGDNSVDEMLRGYIRVITDYREWRLVRVDGGG
ncbi:ATP-NAD kinase [Candidatus Bathyarchaeota archaeon]|nr:MAG: ATP-NAD kinase [Candidatus Bathyarchaeota archaeon]